MQWAEITVHTTHEAQEAVANAFRDHGIEGVQIIDSEEPKRARENKYGEIYDLKKEDFPAWGVYVRAYTPFDETTNDLLCQLDARIVAFKDLGIDIGDFKMTLEVVQEEDWAHQWKEYYHPTRVTESFVIVPMWEKYEKEKEDDLIIQLDPGMAFGTGTHPTTRLSLQMLEDFVEKEDVVIDVGCGSGILSIAAAKLGVEQVVGLDLDPVAVDSAKRNVALNAVSSQVKVQEGNLLDGVTERPTVIVSNILADIILSFSQEAFDALPDGGLFLTSGIIDNQREKVVEKLEAIGFIIHEVRTMEDWIGVVAEKKVQPCSVTF